MMEIFDRYFSKRDGSVGLTGGILLVVLVSASAGAIDLSNAIRGKSELQRHLDAALLSAVRSDLSEPKLRSTVADELTRRTGRETRVELSDTQAANARRLSAVAQQDISSFMLQIAGRDSATVTVDATVTLPLTVREVRLRSYHASGEYNKIMTLMVRRPGAATDTEVARIDYSYDNGTISGPNGWVDLGEYESAYMQMDIDPNSIGFNSCTGCPTTLRSDDPSTSERMFVDGVQMPNGVTLDIFDLTECDGTVAHEWEDGGGGVTDFRYLIDSKCIPSSEMSRIVR